MSYCRVCGNDDPDYKCKCAAEINEGAELIEIANHLKNKARWDREKAHREMLKYYGIEY